ncbi:cytochrome-c peroxidase [Haliangium ochraceum]|uniref:Cytochrome-c peroxidase n=1 Tax=Haliangium ochraceum (strain DSM 14365 / JCM 11303 / SMP-2) TaxID=502025 RepID=D0LMB7_HALO1|nr:cytochrome c peroxidase [Haliangium ochraceum]ACY16823.1 Cytochrome-c peroxidase [Haliangium ochraceum DSM 14365]
MDQQRETIASLVEAADLSVAPASIDPHIWDVIVPDDNGQTPERVALGEKLYFDVRLSADGTVACATCHDVTRSFTDRRPMSEGIGGKVGRRNAPTTMNAALLGTQFWDGRAATLEAQAVLPITNPIEMGQPSPDAAVAAIADDPEYQQMFQAAYGRPVNIDDIGRALAAFERTLIFLDAPFDRYVAGDADAMSPAAIAGWRLFNGKARCVTCHPISIANPIGSDNRFHNIGVSARVQDFESLAKQALALLEEDDSADKIDQLALETDANQLGRFLVTQNYSDVGAFRTSQMRNVGITAPYMHDGTLQTLWDVMDHYNKGGEPHIYLDGGIEPLALSEGEIDQLVAFMFALTDVRFKDLSEQERARQRELASKQRPFRNTARAERKIVTFTSSPNAAPN